MTITGKLPMQGRADLVIAFDETVFSMMAEDLMEKTVIEAIFSYPNKPDESKKKVRIKLTEVVRPGKVNDIAKDTNEQLSEAMLGKYSMDTAISNAMSYILREILLKDTWTLIGHLETRSNLALCILYSPLIGGGAYAIKPIDPAMN